jgi:hypothetical protein
MKGNKISIDGIDFTEDSNLESVKFTYGLNPSDQSYSYQASEELELSGEAYEYIRSKFFTSCDDIENILQVRLYIDICKTVFKLEIKYEDVEICYSEDRECATASVVVANLENKCYKKLNETPFLEDEFHEQDHPIFYYVKAGGFVHNILFLFFPVLAYISVTLAIIFNVIALVCKVIDAIPLVSIDCPDFIRFDSLVCTLYRYIAGTGYKGKFPLVKDIFEYHMANCGGSFKSSILQGDYKNLMLFTMEHGGGVRDINDFVASDTWMTDTSIQLLKKLEPVFNAKFWFEDGVLFFDTDEVFRASLGTFPYSIDEIVLEEMYQGDICVEFIELESPAYGRYEYSDDTTERQGSKTKVKHQYDTIAPWNEEDAEWKNGEYSNIVQFGRSRFMFDRISKADTGLGFDNDLDKFRNGQGIITTPLKYFIGFNNNNSGFNSEEEQSGLCSDDFRVLDLIVSSDEISLPKLILLEEGFDMEDASVDKRSIGDNYFDSNYRMYFDEEYEVAELYQTYHYTRDPNNKAREIYTIPAISLYVDCDKIDCDVLNAIKDSPMGMRIRSNGLILPKGWGTTETISVDYNEGDNISFVTLNNIKFACS